MKILKVVTGTINNFFKLFGFEIIKYEKEKTWHVEDSILHNSKEKINEFYSRENFLDTYIGAERLDFYNCIVNLIESKKINSTGKVVDVGCGTGHLLNFIYDKFRFKKGTGLEYSSEALRIARKLFPSFEYHEYDVNNPWQEKYDFVLCTEVLEHLLHPEIALNNLMNMMAENGKALITVPNGRADTFGGHINFWSPESWEVFIKKNVAGLFSETGSLNNNSANYAIITKPEF
jgi:2-polyprenyl-3-methyl-5-hydroxy-6-metoxy-1,4-benzoquinol methylase